LSGINVLCVSWALMTQRKSDKSVINIFKEIVNEYAGMASIDADYKLIYIDNAESLNLDAQHALRRIMEKYNATCRFILSTTKPSKLIAPLRSRGLQIFFTYVSDSVLKDHLEKISCSEKLQLFRRRLRCDPLFSKGKYCKSGTDSTACFLACTWFGHY